MPSFKEQLDLDLEGFVNPDEFGEDAIYYPVSGPPVGCSVLVDHDVVIQPDSYDAHVVETGTVITAIYNDVGEPRQGSTFVVDGITYTVERITDNDRDFVVMKVTDGS